MLVVMVGALCWIRADDQRVQQLRTKAPRYPLRHRWGLWPTKLLVLWYTLADERTRLVAWILWEAMAKCSQVLFSIVTWALMMTILLSMMHNFIATVFVSLLLMATLFVTLAALSTQHPLSDAELNYHLPRSAQIPMPAVMARPVAQAAGVPRAVTPARAAMTASSSPTSGPPMSSRKLRPLECSVCLDSYDDGSHLPMLCPQCGQSACKQCSSQCNFCPMCRSSLPLVPNRALADALEVSDAPPPLARASETRPAPASETTTTGTSTTAPTPAAPLPKPSPKGKRAARTTPVRRAASATKRKAK